MTQRMNRVFHQTDSSLGEWIDLKVILISANRNALGQKFVNIRNLGFCARPVRNEY